VSIVGYTNAGKSTLLNQLTKSNVLSENKLFATLSPTSRRLRFPDEHEIVFTDTVGFIHALPAELISAFKATLEELEGADLLVHLVDISETCYQSRIQAVNELLADLSLEKKNRIVVFNKTDLVDEQDIITRSTEFDAIAISALKPDSVAPLVEILRRKLF
jgi:GTP-binding protein HflX